MSAIPLDVTEDGMPTARIATATGPNIEEPGLFNQHVGELPAAVESGRWGTWKRAAR